jgi:hypothetical protein
LQQAGTSENEAITFAETVDRDPADFIKEDFGIEWPARHFFHLTNNSTMGDETVVQMVLDGLSPSRRERETIIKTAIETEPILCRRRKPRVDNSKTSDSILSNILDGVAHSRIVLATFPSSTRAGSAFGQSFQMRRNGQGASQTIS